MRSLIVDDSPIIRLLVKQFLVPYGQCDEAKNGREALEKFASRAEEDKRYDLICLDLQMPETNGIEVLHAIRKLEKDGGQTNLVKVFIITAEDDEGAVLEGLKAGADAYLVKPVSRQALFDRIAAILPTQLRDAVEAKRMPVS